MKESAIRRLACDELERLGYIVWWPYDNRWAKEQDIFGVFDLIAIHKKTALVQFVQITTVSNISARKKKVIGFLLKLRWQDDNFIFSVWGYNQKYKHFKQVQL